MIDGMYLMVLAFTTPGRYLMGLSPLPETDQEGCIHLWDPAHMTYHSDRMTLQPIEFMDTFSANVTAYAGFGEADEKAYEVYGQWRELRKNPPEFEVEDSVS